MGIATFAAMKLMSRILLLLFITFLSTPTLVTLIEKQTDVSIFYNFSEEEIHKDLKEIKANLKEDTTLVFFDWGQQENSKIIFENLSRHDNVFSKIFSPPPEIV
jgi:ABC-type uncharacterized transport system substrate-binding protein